MSWTLLSRNLEQGVYYYGLACNFATGTLCMSAEDVLGNHLLRSTDNGETWTRIDMAVAYGQRIFFLNNRWVALGLTGYYWVSTDDGLTWIQYQMPSLRQIRSIARWNNLYVAVGNGFFSCTSLELPETWTVWSYTDTALGLGSFEGTFIATGGAGTIWRSTDGYTWTEINHGLTLGTLNGAACDGSRWYVVGNQSAVAHSDDDGLTWSLGTQTQNPDTLGVPTVTITPGGNDLLYLSWPAVAEAYGYDTEWAATEQGGLYLVNPFHPQPELFAVLSGVSSAWVRARSVGYSASSAWSTLAEGTAGSDATEATVAALSQTSLRMTIPSLPGGATNVTFQSSDSVDGSWADIGTQPQTELAATLTGLDPGSVHWFRVKANNATDWAIRAGRTPATVVGTAVDALASGFITAREATSTPWVDVVRLGSGTAVDNAGQTLDLETVLDGGDYEIQRPFLSYEIPAAPGDWWTSAKLHLTANEISPLGAAFQVQGGSQGTPLGIGDFDEVSGVEVTRHTLSVAGGMTLDVSSYGIMKINQVAGTGVFKIAIREWIHDCQHEEPGTPGTLVRFVSSRDSSDLKPILELIA